MWATNCIVAMEAHQFGNYHMLLYLQFHSNQSFLEECCCLSDSKAIQFQILYYFYQLIYYDLPFLIFSYLLLLDFGFMVHFLNLNN